MRLWRLELFKTPKAWMTKLYEAGLIMLYKVLDSVSFSVIILELSYYKKRETITVLLSFRKCSNRLIREPCKQLVLWWQSHPLSMMDCQNKSILEIKAIVIELVIILAEKEKGCFAGLKDIGQRDWVYQVKRTSFGSSSQLSKVVCIN